MAVLLELTIALLVLSAVMPLTGWALAHFANIRRLQGFRFEALAANSLVGTATWILTFGWCSYTGLAVREVRWPLAAAVLVLILVACRRSRPRISFRSIRSGPALLCIFGTIMAVGLIWWPLAYCASVWAFNDTFIYCTLSTWLQNNGFGIGAIPVDSDRPFTWQVADFQRNHWRMGASFFLALLQGYTGLDALLAYPLAMAWAMILNLASIFLMARWTFRLNRWAASGACFAAAVALNPLHTTIQQGFQPQLFGTAYFGAALAVLSRATHSAFWSRANALLLAIVVTTLVSVYSEMAPILAFAGAAYIVLTAILTVRSGRAPRGVRVNEAEVNPPTPHSPRHAASNRLLAFGRFGCWTVLFTILLGNIEWFRAYQAIRTAVGVAVGYSIPWSDAEYWGFALGQLHFNHRPALGPRRTLMILFATLCFLIGVTRLVYDRRAAVTGLALFVFAAMVFYFRFQSHDPITGEMGHRWSLFKIGKWVFPLLLIVQFAGLAVLVRRVRMRRLLFIAPGIAAFLMTYAYHREHIIWAGKTMCEVAQSAAPLDEWKHLNSELDRLGAQRIYLLRHDGGRVPEILMPYVLRSRRFVNGWSGCDLLPVRATDPALVDPDAVVLLCGAPPFESDGQRLSANMTLLDKSRPHLFHIETDRRCAGGDTIDIGLTAIRFWIWSPRAGRLSMLAETPTTAPGTVCIKDGAGLLQTTATARNERVEAIISVPAGRSCLLINVLPSPANVDSPTIRWRRPRVEFFEDAKATFRAVHSSALRGAQ